jgi:ribonucleoside-diphosphate reductase alpha chain
MGHTTNPEIRLAKSVVDYIFRWMGMNFLHGYREACQGFAMKTEGESGLTGYGLTPTAEPAAARIEIPAPSTNGHGRGGNGKVDLEMLERAGVAMRVAEGENGVSSRSDQFARFQSDAPACDNCGAITVRNGNCYLCHNCGNSMGCS